MTYPEFPLKEIRRLIDDAVPFAAVRFPHETEWHSFLSTVQETPDDSVIEIYNFGTGKKKGICLYDNKLKSTNHESLWSVKASNWEQTFEDYTIAVNTIVDKLKTHGGKIVYSRRKALQSSSHPAEVGQRYFAKHPEAFCFIYNTPQTGCWLGATPELIVDIKGETVTGMALAGTKSATDDSPWDEKNLREHDFVLQHIVDCFTDSGLCDIKINFSDTVTGAVRHLRHTITAKGKAELKDLTFALSPTPAICGTPTDWAEKCIYELEAQPRLCYGGEILYADSDHTVSFLNLRSALVSPADNSLKSWNYNIFCGGGITANSSAADEWQETELKATSLCNAITNQ